MLISLSSLATTGKSQKNICFKMRAVGLINTNTMEWKRGRHFWKSSIPLHRIQVFRMALNNSVYLSLTPILNRLAFNFGD